jgi:hypothetical protein
MVLQRRILHSFYSFEKVEGDWRKSPQHKTVFGATAQVNMASEESSTIPKENQVTQSNEETETMVIANHRFWFYIIDLLVTRACRFARVNMSMLHVCLLYMLSFLVF